MSSYSEPFLPELLPVAEEVVRTAFQHNSFISFSTKRRPNKAIINLLAQNAHRTTVSISLSSMDAERNATLEPGAPTAPERLEFARELTNLGIPTWIKADTLFPSLDDPAERVRTLLEGVRATGVDKLLLSYAFHKGGLSSIPCLHNALGQMTESQPIVTGEGYSLPLHEKRERYKQLGQLARSLGFQTISTCGCKNQSLAPADIGFDSVECLFHWPPTVLRKGD